MERYEQLFKQLEARKEGAFVPFVTLGDPSPEQSLRIIDTLIEAGADALELGIPFSDPLADGPTIQNATLRAFASGVTPAQCFEMLAAIRLQQWDRCVLSEMRAGWCGFCTGRGRAGGRVCALQRSGIAPQRCAYFYLSA